MRNASLRLFAFTLASASLVSASGCSGAKPTEEACQAFSTHYIDLLKKGDAEGNTLRRLPQKQQDRLLELCVEKGTAAEVECAMQQESIQGIADNCK